MERIRDFHDFALYKFTFTFTYQAMMRVWRLFVAYIGHNSRTERPTGRLKLAQR